MNKLDALICERFLFSVRYIYLAEISPFATLKPITQVRKIEINSRLWSDPDLSGQPTTTAERGESHMPPKSSPKKPTKIGRDAGSGKIIPVKQAQAKKKTAVVETIKPRKKGN
jgi:hypothetical protein